LSWDSPPGQTDTDVYFKAGSTPCTFTGDNIAATGDIESVSNALLVTELGGEMTTGTDYCWQVVVNPDDENVTSGPYYFTTAEGPPAVSSAKPGVKYNVNAPGIRY